jgi:hypothetical protein
VIESPKVTIPPVSRELVTSTLESQNHDSIGGIVESTGIQPLPVKSP